ncbi:MAG: ATP-binding protein [Pseudomonadota bacterium]
MLTALMKTDGEGHETLNRTAELALPVRSNETTQALLRGVGLIALAQLIFWVLLSIGEDLSRPDGLTAPETVTLYLTKNWQVEPGDTPIEVPLDTYPLYDYKDASADPATNRGVFVTQFTVQPDAGNLAVFFSSSYGLKEVRLNGRLIKAESAIDPQGSLSGFGPRGFALPDEFVRSGDNELVVLSSGRRYKSLPLYFVGPADDIMRAARWGQVFAIDLVVAATALMGFVALFCLLVNWPAEDKPRIHALVALLLTWLLRNLSILGLFDFLPLLLLRVATYTANYLPLAAFVFLAVAWSGYGKSLLKFRWHVYALCILIPIILVTFDWRTLPIGDGLSLPWLLDNGLTLIAMPLVIVLFARYYATESSADGIEVLLFVVCATALLVDKLDNMFSLSIPFADSLYLTFYSAPMFGLSLALGMTASIAAQATRARMAEASINKQLADKLAASEEQIRQQARTRARVEERRRIMQDMHDSLGSRLSGLVAEASDPEFPRQALVTELTESIQELRLIVDSLDTEGDSLATALGSYRSRIEPMLRAAGIELVWKIDDVDGGAMSAEQVLDVFRILQAALGNVIQHSDADRVEVSLSIRNANLCLSIDDNGKGMASDHAAGNGLDNMRARAHRLGGELSIESSDDGVILVLTIPANQEKHD